MFYDERGRSVLLGECLGRGAEGQVYRVQGATRGCVKVFEPALRTQHRAEKIRAMIDCRPCGGILESSAWPRAMIYEDAGRTRFAGFVMVMLDMSAHVELQSTWDSNGGFGWLERGVVAANLASAVVELHQAGHRVGDLRERNVLVDAHSQVRLVDCDSFEIHDRSGQIYFSGVGTPDYLPPELLFLTHRKQGSLRGIERYHSDLHALAVIVFQLLMNGTHPYSARGPGVTHSLAPRVEKIMAGTYPYVDTGGQFLPPSHAPAITVVPPAIVALFRQVFVDGHRDCGRRPSAAQWRDALLVIAKSTVVCRADRSHSYSNHLSACPWCKAIMARKHSRRIRTWSPMKTVSVGFAITGAIVMLIFLLAGL
jgi:DNA-binding helix-hairpin-helix protein with protein kinase domain